MSSLRHFLSELRRRRVYRVAFVYAAVAFVVWQVADIALPGLGLPEAAVTLVLVLTLLGFPVALVLAWAYELRPEEPSPPLPVESSAGAPVAPEIAAASAGPDASAGRPGSIAILPFENMTTEEESEYFADGISEELTHALGRMPSLRVAARTSAFAFKGQRLDVREIGVRLNVAHVVEGSVRRAGDRLRVTAQLIDTANGYHVWSDRFERELDDVFAIQDDIVAAVVESLLRTLEHPSMSEERGPAEPITTEHLTRTTLALPRTDDLDAYDLYLRARHALTRYEAGAIHEAVRLCEQAIQRDPTFAPAHATLAVALTTQGLGFLQGAGEDVLPRARAAAERAISLDPDLPDAHLARGLSLLYHDWAFPEARSELEEALRLNPSSADAHRWMEFYWTYVEADSDAALASLARARELDPLDSRVPLREATVHFLFGDYAKAEAFYREAIEREPDSPIVIVGLVDCLFRAGRAVEGAEFAARLPIADEVPDVALAVTGWVLGAGGRTEDARVRLRELEARAIGGGSSPFWRASIHAGLGEMDDAFRLFEEAFEMREGAMLYWARIPAAPGLQDDPRYVSILRRMGLGHLLPTILTASPR